MALGEWEIAKAEISRLDAMIAERVVRAPFDGVIGLVEVSPGAIVTPDTHIATLRNLDELDVRFEVPERFASRIRLDQPLQLRAFDSQNLIDARITALESGLNTLNRTLAAQARLQPDASLRPGALVQVRLILEERPGALTIPTTAITESLEGSSVWVLQDDNTVKARTIEKGARTDARVEVLEGLSEGERVVVTGRQALEEGDKVRVDDSDDALDVNDIVPEATTPGMRNQWFSEEVLEETLKEAP
ncbi:efflux RND transporter periplasmic adaptor subunit [Lujinxingia vulgaris]|uniref:Efflux RND transporter periplasmic adaptor subunit n=1 Tax=Lujinxingia vulgaris TaxID=2600176 RepID=A0A5C6WZJ5_9DELT|nr:efflux RND transporter periplasmic adaptor subunit [Lujinxingia vulgaris]